MKIASILAIILFVATDLAYADAPSIAPHYSISEVYYPIVITAINDKQQITGTITASNGYMHACLWQNGSLNDLGTLPGSVYSEAIAINNHGLILVGTSAGSFLWNDGKKFPIALLAGSLDTIPNCGLNDNNLIVGWCMANLTRLSSVVMPYRYKGTQTHIFHWSDNRLTDLGSVPGLEQSDEGHLINNEGQIAGEGAHSVFLLSKHIRQTICSVLPIDSVKAVALNDKGEILGARIRSEKIDAYGSWGNAFLEPFLWSKGKLQFLPKLSDSTHTTAIGLNNLSQVIGYDFSLPNPDDKMPVPLLWCNNSVYNLNDLIPKTSGFTLTRSCAINNLGEIVCYGYKNPPEHMIIIHGMDNQIFLLKPVIEAK